MDVKMSISTDGSIKISTGSGRVRLDSVDKFLGRNRDAVLVKLEETPALSFECKPGHITSIEREDDQHFNVFVGKHYIGQLPEEAISFANSIEAAPEFMVSIVGKVEDGIFIYIAE